MRRVVIDTNVYVDWLNRGDHEKFLLERDTLKYLSAVVRRSPAIHEWIRSSGATRIVPSKRTCAVVMGLR